MEPPAGSPLEDTASQSLGDDEFRERQDAKPTVISVTGGDVGKDLLSEPERGAAAEGEESHGGAGAPGPVDEIQKGGDGGEEPPQQQQEAHAATEDPQPQDRQPRLRHLFTRLELKELESVFQRTQYPDVFARAKATYGLEATEICQPLSSVQGGSDAYRAGHRERRLPYVWM
ncbi:rhox homeobox family member 1-like isoform X1 [Panthera pardus]|uniref:Rhox homeobox family member 1-like isoform X1 n=1 Tax=Panthera pardus TaxID=9691 RepID=A0A9V1EAI8_PANPR|nr:rhox homeobox family member 1-like isoform X1 [Panthera pardus]